MIREEHMTSTKSNEHTHNWNASDTLQEKKRKLVYNIFGKQRLDFDCKFKTVSRATKAEQKWSERLSVLCVVNLKKYIQLAQEKLWQ